MFDKNGMSATPMALGLPMALNPDPADLQPLRRSRGGYSSPDGGSTIRRAVAAPLAQEWDERHPSGRVYLG